MTSVIFIYSKQSLGTRVNVPPTITVQCQHVTVVDLMSSLHMSLRISSDACQKRKRRRLQTRTPFCKFRNLFVF